MKLVKLIDIDLLESSVTGSSYDEYVIGTTYATDDNVKVSFESDGTTPKAPVEEYVSLADANVGNYPEDSPAKWSLLGVSNKWKMFDGYVNSQTEDTETITVEIDSSNTNKIGLFDLQGSEVTLSQIVDTELITNGDCSSDSFTKGPGWKYDAVNDEYDCESCDGTLYNMNDADWVDGKVGKCLSFDSTNDEYVQTDRAFFFTDGMDMSISLWVKPASFPDSWGGTGCFKYNAGMDGTGWSVIACSGGIRISVGRTGSNHAHATFSCTIPTTSFSHIVATYSSGIFKAYLNGVKVGSDYAMPTVFDTVNGNEFQFGRWATDHPSYNIDGLVDEIRLYDKTLTLSEIGDLHSDPSGSSSPTENLIGYWPLNETSGAVAPDESSARRKLYQDISSVEDKKYIVKFTVKNRTAGNITAIAGGTAGTNVTANGEYAQIITAGSTSEDGISASAAFVGSVDDVSVMRISNNETIEISLDESYTPDYWYYFFSDFTYKEDISWDYSFYSNSKMRIEITLQAGSAKCGMVALGRAIVLGKTHYEPHISIDDYSKKTTDSLGRTYLAQGNYAKKLDFDFWLDNTNIDIVRRALANVRGTPVIIDANNEGVNYGSLIIYGFIGSFDIIIPGPNKSKCTFEGTGLI